MPWGGAVWGAPSSSKLQGRTRTSRRRSISAGRAARAMSPSRWLKKPSCVPAVTAPKQCRPWREKLKILHLLSDWWGWFHFLLLCMLFDVHESEGIPSWRYVCAFSTQFAQYTTETSQLNFCKQRAAGAIERVQIRMRPIRLRMLNWWLGPLISKSQADWRTPHISARYLPQIYYMMQETILDDPGLPVCQGQKEGKTKHDTKHAFGIVNTMQRPLENSSGQFTLSTVLRCFLNRTGALRGNTRLSKTYFELCCHKIDRIPSRKS